MKRGKAAGVDNLTFERITFGHPSLIYHFCHFNDDAFGSGIIIPLVKDKHVDLSSSDNYRGITVSPVISKVFQLCLLCKFGHLLSSNELQLGFNKNIGCAPGLFPMRNVNYIVSQKTSQTFLAVTRESLVRFS